MPFFDSLGSRVVIILTYLTLMDKINTNAFSIGKRVQAQGGSTDFSGSLDADLRGRICQGLQAEIWSE